MKYSWLDDQEATQPDDLAAQIRALLASGSTREPSAMSSSAARVKPVSKGSGLQVSGKDSTSDLLAKLQRAITFPSADAMKEAYEVAGNDPDISRQRSTLDQIEEALAAQAQAQRGQGGDPTSALSYLANYFTKGQAKYLPPEKTAKDTLMDYQLKAQDDRRDLSKTISDYVSKMRGGYTQTSDTKGGTTNFNITATDPNMKTGSRGTKGPRLVPETTVAKFSQGQAAIDEVNALRSEIAAKHEIMGPIKGLTSYSPFTFDDPDIENQKELNNRFMLLRQTVGKLFEGGVLRKEDEVKYKKIFVDIKTDPKIAAANMKELESMLRRDVPRYMKNMGRAGYDVSGFLEQVQGASTSRPDPVVAEKKFDKTKLPLNITPDLEKRRQDLLKKAKGN